MMKVEFINKVNELIKEWNNEIANYPLDEKIIKEKLIEHLDVIDSYALVNEDNQYVASIVLKKCYKGDVLNGYISLIHVKREYRKQGIATRMIKEALELFKEEGLNRVWLGCDYGCLFSGLFIDNNEEDHKFFLNRGFTFDHNTHNMLLSQKIETPKTKDYEYCLLREDLRDEFEEFTKKFSRRWSFENKNVSCGDVVLILNDKKIIAFARICMKDSKVLTNGINNFRKYEKDGRVLGALGPLGVDKEFRKTGLGKEIVLYGIEELYKRGATDILIDWTSLIDFYKKACFADICDVYSQYRYEIF